MSILISLTPREQERLAVAARQAGLAPEAWVETMVREHLPAVSPLEEMHRRIAEWQRQDRTPPPYSLPPRDGLTPTAALFAQWAEEDAQMTDEERQEDERIFAEIEMNGIPRIQI